MARTTKPLTDTEVKKAKPKEKEYNLADGNGLYLRVKPNSSKLWLFNYIRPHTKKRANIGLGQYPALSLAKAREAKRLNLELLSEDIDPGTHRTEQKRLKGEANENTLERVAHAWFQVKKSKVTKDYGEDIYRSLILHIFPALAGGGSKMDYA